MDNKTQQRYNRKKYKSIIQKVLLSVLAILFLALIGISIYGYTLLNMIKHGPLESNNDKPMPITKDELGIPLDAPNPKDTGIKNILILGLDRRARNQASRSDAMMIATIDTKNDEIKLTSLMRDMYVDIPGKEYNRINTGYIFGGPALAIKTVNQNFKMNIEHYIAVDFEGFEEIIDLLGGVPISITNSEAKIMGFEQAGTYTLNGKKALTYSRIRRIGGDYERTDRQRTVLNKLLGKSKNVGLLKVPEMISTIFPHIETNLTKMEIIKMGLNFADDRTNELKEFRLPIKGSYSNQRIRNMAVLVPDIKRNTDALHEFIYGSE